MDPDILELIGQERLLEAAQRARGRGQAALASTLFERACDWANAAAQAIASQDFRRALDLALRAGDEAIAARAAAGVIAEPATADTVATHLAQRGEHGWAARILEATGREAEAAHAWERAGGAVRAARLFERGGDIARAVHVLEAALRRGPDGGAALALGALLVRLGKDEAAVRVLQRIGRDAPERREALGYFTGALERAGLESAAKEAAAELSALGGIVAPAATAMALEPTPRDRLFGRYCVRSAIASSPTARVLDCDDPVRGERVAVKVFAAVDGGPAGRRARARFAQDLAVVAALNSPNIVPVRAFFADVPATVLAWMDGGTLDQMLSRVRLAPGRAAEIAGAVLDALVEAHRHGILHGDVKASNVLFDAAGAARLGDFGTAHLSDASATATAGAFGALAYRSPEEREGQPPSTRSEIFSVGVLLHEMLTGQRPDPATPNGTTASAAHPELGAAHDALVARWIARAPAMRPVDAIAARGEIRALSWPAHPRPAPPDIRLGFAGCPEPRRERLDPPCGAIAVDAWTGRAIERIPLADAVLARARAFAAADHPALQSVLRVDREGAALWLSAARGDALARPLTGDERARLGEALDALHRAGIAHGAVDAAHVTIENPDGVVLGFAAVAEPSATFEGDREALARMA